MRQSIRVLVAILLLSALCGLFVHSGATEEAQTQYPRPDQLAADYDRYVGETVLVFGRVTERNAAEMVIVAESEGVSISLRVTDASTTVNPGGTVQVYGELQPGQTIAAERIVVVNASGDAEWYKYLVSVVGAVGFLVAFARHWWVDTDSWTLEGRDG